MFQNIPNIMIVNSSDKYCKKVNILVLFFIIIDNRVAHPNNHMHILTIFLPTTAFDETLRTLDSSLSATIFLRVLCFSHKKSRVFCFYIAIILLDHEMSSSPTWCFTSPQGQRWFGRALTLCCHILGCLSLTTHCYYLWSLNMTATASLHAGEREKEKNRVCIRQGCTQK